MGDPTAAPSARKTELLEAAYDFVLKRGMTELSLRPLAAAIGSSPRVLLFLFGSKDGLVKALLSRAREDELSMLELLRQEHPDLGLADALLQLWTWLSEARHRNLLRLWVEGYARSLVDPAGPWAGFARQSVDDWLKVLSSYQPSGTRRGAASRAQRTAALTLLRGALLDLLATGDERRVTASIELSLDLLRDQAGSREGRLR
jgi:AcrR family transcriptional regulator